MHTKSLLKFLLLTTFLIATSSQASVVVMGTRFVFPAQDREIGVELENTNKTPALLQIWFDDGDEASRGENVPLNALPPLFKMQPNSKQNLRIVKTQANLPKDRESVFYLNILEIPPKPTFKKGEPQNYLQFSIRSRFKIFHRPQLKMPRNQAEKNIEWRLVQKGKSVLLEAKNSSPYFISFGKVEFETSSGKKYLVQKPSMLSPFKNIYFQLDKFTQSASTKGKINFSSINDYGGRTQVTKSIGG